jgi:hypothetical protein
MYALALWAFVGATLAKRLLAFVCTSARRRRPPDSANSDGRSHGR